jgi:diguanylate cyclase (GGDEF)-like protein
MHVVISLLNRQIARWRQEHGTVAGRAHAVNLDRLRALCPVVAVINGVDALVFLVQLMGGSLSGAAYKWTLSLCVLHTAMGVAMVVSALVAHQLRGAVHSFWAKWLPTLVAGLGMLFAAAIVAADQWVTPNITPYLLGCVLISVALYIRPGPSACLYLLAYGGFFYAMGMAQEDPAQLLSNRLNGLAASIVGWALSVVLWRKFTIIALQQDLLTRANTELQSKQRDLERLTRLDGLTGLFNRNTFVDLTVQEFDRAQRQGNDTAILLLDLDHFKLINDTWGHPAGDAVLRNVANAMRAAVRSTDLVGRLGGEEFVVLLPGTSIVAARTLAEKLRARLQGSPTRWENGIIACTASIGMAGTTAKEKRDFDSLYNEADKALYMAKTRGRNRVEP